MLPDYQIKEWNETNSPLDNAYCRAAHAAGSWSKLANYIRLHALHTEGGIYLDTDVEVVKSFAPLLHHKCFLGFQQQEEQLDWINNAILGAQPGHPFLQQCIALTVNAFALTGEFYRSPTVITAALKEMGLSEYGRQEVRGVAIYPTEYFYPYPWFGSFSYDCVKEETYCIHHWEGTWRKKPRKALALPRMMTGMIRTLISKAEQLKPSHSSSNWTRK